MNHRIRRVSSAAVLAAAWSVGGAVAADTGDLHDVLIRNALIYDGSGAPPYTGEVAIDGDRIAYVGSQRALKGRSEIDAHGQAVAPGFIDMLNHSAESLLIDGRAVSGLKQGVTLDVFAEQSMGPLTAQMARLMVERQGDLKFPVTWNTLGQYLQHLEQKGISPNVASFVGEGEVRTNILGEGDVAPTPTQLNAMRALVHRAMEEGALGITTSLIYAPMNYAKTAELIAMAKESARCGGIYTAHMRSEGDHIEGAVQETIDIARASGAPAEIHHLKFMGRDNWGKFEKVVGMIDAARASGTRITADMYTYTAGATGLDSSMPPWVHDGGQEVMLTRLKDPAIRAKVIAAMREQHPKDWENLLRQAGPEGVLILGAKHATSKSLIGKTIAEIAKARAVSPEEAIIDLVIEDEAGESAAYDFISADNIPREIALPWVSFGSDAGSSAPEGAFLLSSTHPRAYGNFARLFAEYVRDEHVLSVEEAVRRLTSLPADVLSLADRGRLRAGAFADVVIFDPKAFQDHSTYAKPLQYATGVTDVFVNGRLALKDGEPTGAHTGRVVHGRAWTGAQGGGCRASSKDWTWIDQPPAATALFDSSHLQTASGAVAPAPTTHSLDAADANAWLDGFLPYALKSGDIAGAVVEVVKDGQVLIERGYGHADVEAQSSVDPQRTLFRMGSVSKLFTWTAVMQLVEAGKLNLDADINTYLDFKIPPRDGKPITLRNLMTHTPGFEEAIKHLFATDPQHILQLGALLKTWTPERMYPPGEVPAYSNYGAALAGYIVERVSGEPFEQYIDRHIFRPLGMEYSTLVQPLPATLDAEMSKGYKRASEPPKSFELLGPAPAGGLSSTGSDMARFMIAHLQDGRYDAAQILKPETARLMHAQANMPTPPFPGMALGFYRADRNGHVVIGHGGDTVLFHSDLHLFLNDGVGLFISMNSLGRDEAASSLRELLYQGFVDRYFPAAPASALPTLASAKQDGDAFAGSYWESGRSDSNFLRIGSLVGQITVNALPDGTLETPEITTAGGGIKHWREVGPFLWQEIGGRTLLKAVVENGRIDHFSLGDEAAIEVYQPVPAPFNARWNLPVFYASCAILLLTVLLWPVSVLVRRKCGQKFALSGRAAILYRVVRLTALVDLALVVGWFYIVSLLRSNLAELNDPLNPWLRILQLLGLLGILGAVAAALNVVTAWRDSSRTLWTKLSSTLIAFACVAMAWLICLLRLLGPSLNF